MNIIKQLKDGNLYQCPDCNIKIFISWEDNRCQCFGCVKNHCKVKEICSGKKFKNSKEERLYKIYKFGKKINLKDYLKK